MESRPAHGYLDLLVALGWLTVAAGATALSLDGIVRLVLLIPTTVFLPGWAVVSLAYPTEGAPPEEATIGPTGVGLEKAFARDNHAIGGIERVALAVLWSLVVVPAVTLAVHFSAFPISARPIQVAVFATTFVLLFGAVLARARQSDDERYAPGVPSLSNFPGRSSGFGTSSFGTSSPTLGGSTSTSRSWPTLLFAVSLLVLASSVGYALVATPTDESFTELYVQSENVTDETTSLYPSSLVRGQTQPFEFGVTNREGSSVEYGYVVALQRVERPATAGSVGTDRPGQNGSNASGGANASSGANASAEVLAQTEIDRGSFELADGETRNVTARVTPQTTGDDLRVVVLVYRGDVPANPGLDSSYRSLRLPVEVTATSRSDN